MDTNQNACGSLKNKDALLKDLKSINQSVRFYATRHPKADEEILNQAIRDPHRYVREAVLRHPKYKEWLSGN